MKLPPFTQTEALPTKASFDLLLLEDAEAFRGHFPGQAVLPGVVQLDWVMQLAKAYFKIADRGAKNFQIKFQNVISLGPVSLIMTLEQNSDLLSFSYNKASMICSSGKIKLVGHD